jgi:hypothetical protein
LGIVVLCEELDHGQQAVVFLSSDPWRTYVEEILQQHVRLIFGHALDAACEASVDEDAFPSGYGWFFCQLNLSAGLRKIHTICSDYWVDCF